MGARLVNTDLDDDLERFYDALRTMSTHKLGTSLAPLLSSDRRRCLFARALAAGVAHTSPMLPHPVAEALDNGICPHLTDAGLVAALELVLLDNDELRCFAFHRYDDDTQADLIAALVNNMAVMISAAATN